MQMYSLKLVALVARHVPHSHNVISLILARDSLLLFPVRLYNINRQKKPGKNTPPTTQPPKKQQKQCLMSPWA